MVVDGIPRRHIEVLSDFDLAASALRDVRLERHLAREAATQKAEGKASQPE